MANGTERSLVSSVMLQRRLRHFMNWWQGELAAMIPWQIRRWWRGSGQVVILHLDEERAVFERPTESGFEEIISAGITNKNLTVSPATIHQRLAQAMGADYRVFLAIPQERVLQRTISLPAAVAENLHQTLRFELDRFTPFRPDQAYFDYRLGEGAGTTETLCIELAVAPRQAIDQRLSTLASLGISVHGATPAEDFKTPGLRYRNLLPTLSNSPPPSTRSKRRIASSILAVTLLVALLAIPVWQKRVTAIALLGPLAQAKTAADEANTLRDKLGKLVEAHNFPLDRKWASHSPLIILEELSARLKDDTFVIQLEFDGKTITLQGESASAADLVEALESSPAFKDVVFKSQLTKIQGTTVDRFHIAATIEEGARPRPQSSESLDAQSGPATSEAGGQIQPQAVPQQPTVVPQGQETKSSSPAPAPISKTAPAAGPGPVQTKEAGKP